MSSQCLDSLRQMSARIGHNPDLIQAGGGNTSIKLDGHLWVKASGMWLTHADRDEIFIPVPMDAILSSIDRGEEYLTEVNGLRPSVETTLHAVIPHACVVHVHSVNTLAWAALSASPAAFAHAMEGIRWEWIPYVHPGLPLALRIREALPSNPDVFVMQNHGLIVGGESCESAEALLHVIECRLHLAMRAAPPPQLDALAELAVDGWRVAEDANAHALGTDPDSYRIASGGTMYPDHCVYLGHALATCRAGESASEATARYEKQWGTRPPVLACEGLGVLTSSGLSRAGREMLVCLANVARRIPADTQVHYLEYDQVARLMNWDAEHYRQAIARQMEQQ